MADVFEIDAKELERLQQAMENFAGDTEKAINDVLHNEAGQLIQESIRNLIPVSGRRKWRGKKPPAKKSKSMQDEQANLSITVKTTKSYSYLYFPDDGSNTKRHAGNKQFFRKGAEKVQGDIVDRCVNKLINNLDNLV